MKVSNDKYELPEIIADSAKELADKLGISVNTIHSRNRYSRQHGQHLLYVKIDVEEDEE